MVPWRFFWHQCLKQPSPVNPLPLLCSGVVVEQLGADMPEK